MSSSIVEADGHRAVSARWEFSDELQAAVDRWDDWTLDPRDVTLEHLARWGKEARDGAADCMVRFLKFGEVYPTLSKADKKVARESWRWSRTYACNAARAVMHVKEVCGGRIPDNVLGPTDLTNIERNHRLGKTNTARKKLKDLKAVNDKVDDEQADEVQEDRRKPNPHPVLSYLLGLKTWMAENPDEVVPTIIAVEARRLLGDIARMASVPAAKKPPASVSPVEPKSRPLAAPTEPVGAGDGSDVFGLFGGPEQLDGDRDNPEQGDLESRVRAYMVRVHPETPTAKAVIDAVGCELSPREIVPVLRAVGAETVPKTTKSKQANMWRLQRDW